jgi:hypothetical protein
MMTEPKNESIQPLTTSEQMLSEPSGELECVLPHCCKQYVANSGDAAHEPTNPHSHSRYCCLYRGCHNVCSHVCYYGPPDARSELEIAQATIAAQSKQIAEKDARIDGFMAFLRGAEFQRLDEFDGKDAAFMHVLGVAFAEEAIGLGVEAESAKNWLRAQRDTAEATIATLTADLAQARERIAAVERESDAQGEMMVGRWHRIEALRLALSEIEAQEINDGVYLPHEFPVARCVRIARAALLADTKEEG